jgi:hypothetical protein
VKHEVNTDRLHLVPRIIHAHSVPCGEGLNLFDGVGHIIPCRLIVILALACRVQMVIGIQLTDVALVLSISTLPLNDEDSR